MVIHINKHEAGLKLEPAKQNANTPVPHTQLRAMKSDELSSHLKLGHGPGKSVTERSLCCYCPGVVISVSESHSTRPAVEPDIINVLEAEARAVDNT
jgi:hypothetical protein